MQKLLAKLVLPVLAGAFLTACAPIDALRNASTGRPAPSTQTTTKSLDDKCATQERMNSWTIDCLEWKRQRDAAAEEERLRDEATRSEQRRLLAEQRRLEQARREHEHIAAKREDERLGYKTLTFEDFALDASSMIGAKVAIHGFYTPKGDRLARDPISAAFWIEGSRDNSATLIPLATHAATRDSRALLLRCQESLIGWCPLVVRGRIQSLTMRNRLGATSRQIGLVVESVR